MNGRHHSANHPRPARGRSTCGHSGACPRRADPADPVDAHRPTRCWTPRRPQRPPRLPQPDDCHAAGLAKDHQHVTASCTTYFAAHPASTRH